MYYKPFKYSLHLKSRKCLLSEYIDIFQLEYLYVLSFACFMQVTVLPSCVAVTERVTVLPACVAVTGREGDSTTCMCSSDREGDSTTCMCSSDREGG